MSTVYLGRDINTGRLAAVKVLKKQYTQENDHIERFFTRQIKLTGDLNHPNIVKLLDYGKSKDIYFLVYELIQGVSLDRYLKKHKLSLSQIESMSLQILKGLSYAHKKGLVHRDIKPQNILITLRGIAKITDFGIARALSSSTITQTGMFIGSPGYVSPEQADGKKVNTTSDLYSFGVVLFEMLTRKLPFTSDTPWGIVNKHINEAPPDISKIVKDIPPYLSHVVYKCLVKSPSGRFSSADEIKQVIKNRSFAYGTVIRDFRNDEVPKDYNLSPPSKEKSSNMKKVWIGIGSVVTFFIIISIITSIAGRANREATSSNINYENAPRIEEIIISSTNVSPGETIDIDFILDKGSYDTIEWIAAGGEIIDKALKRTYWTVPNEPGSYSLTVIVTNKDGQSDTDVVTLIVVEETGIASFNNQDKSQIDTWILNSRKGLEQFISDFEYYNISNLNDYEPIWNIDLVLTNSEVKQVRDGNYEVAVLWNYPEDFPYWNAYRFGLYDALDYLRFELIDEVFTEFDSNKANSSLEYLLAARPDVIITTFTEGDSELYKKITDSGIKTIFLGGFPLNLIQGREYYSHASTNWSDFGKYMADALAEEMGRIGDIGLLLFDINHPIINVIDNGFRYTINNNYPDIKIVAEEKYLGPDSMSTGEAVESMISEYPGIDGLYVYAAATEAMITCESMGRKDIKIVSFNDMQNTDLLEDMLLEGNICALITEAKYNTGIDAAILAAYGVLEKDTTGAVVSPVLTLTKDNIKEIWDLAYRVIPFPDEFEKYLD